MCTYTKQLWGLFIMATQPKDVLKDIKALSESTTNVNDAGLHAESLLNDLVATNAKPHVNAKKPNSNPATSKTTTITTATNTASNVDLQQRVGRSFTAYDAGLLAIQRRSESIMTKNASASTASTATSTTATNTASNVSLQQPLETIFTKINKARLAINSAEYKVFKSLIMELKKLNALNSYDSAGYSLMYYACIKMILSSNGGDYVVFLEDKGASMEQALTLFKTESAKDFVTADSERFTAYVAAKERLKLKEEKFAKFSAARLAINKEDYEAFKAAVLELKRLRALDTYWGAGFSIMYYACVNMSTHKKGGDYVVFLENEGANMKQALSLSSSIENSIVNKSAYGFIDADMAIYTAHAEAKAKLESEIRDKALKVYQSDEERRLRIHILLNYHLRFEDGHYTTRDNIKLEELMGHVVDISFDPENKFSESAFLLLDKIEEHTSIFAPRPLKFTEEELFRMIDILVENSHLPLQTVMLYHIDKDYPLLDVFKTHNSEKMRNFRLLCKISYKIENKTPIGTDIFCVLGRLSGFSVSLDNIKIYINKQSSKTGVSAANTQDLATYHVEERERKGNILIAYEGSKTSDATTSDPERCSQCYHRDGECLCIPEEYRPVVAFN